MPSERERLRPPPARHLVTTPITDDDAAIAAALTQVSTPALIASAVHLGGDVSLLRGPIRPRQFVVNEFQGCLDEDEKDQLRRDALKVICAWRDAGCPPPQPLDTATIREIMDWIACTPVPDDYASLYIEEMDLDAVNPRAINLVADNVAPESFSVLVIGCGESGLLAGIRLKEAGIAFQIVDKNNDVGGTWLENTYPGCRVDVASHYYSYSFERNDQFSDYYTRQPELHAYFRKIMAEHGIGEHVLWRHEVIRAEWDDAEARWTVTLRAADGTESTRTANAVISGVGILNRPFVPDLPNLDRFAGPVFHSARWDHSVDLTGKRVALIGAGASGFQIGPAIVDDVRQLVVFQRTPQWMAPNPRYHSKVTGGERWAMAHLPGYARWYRFMLMWQSSDQLLELVRADPDWPDFPRTANQASAARREVFTKWIESQLSDHPELIDAVTPNYPPMAKRMLQDNGSWLRCLTRDHVELVREPIRDIDANSIRTDRGHYRADVIVLATGFRASEVLWPMQVIGRDGIALHDVWDGKPVAYNGVSIPGFPNFFVMMGPGTGLAHAGSVMLMSELQMRYIGEALRAVIEGGRASIEPTPAAYRRYATALQREMATLMWGHPCIEHSWYKAADGNVYVLLPWRIVDYWKMTRTVAAQDHQLR
ncbi:MULTISPECIES: flavin-containing monooxygenase [Mycobacterium]|uniref:flavin-containing monooxygenase n=1 Tax=Mycobacterium TaxID=1763 RepID=UPI001EE27D13|nr:MULTISPECIES: NAD(P)/FAD-dependent oxidoreductase [Mycobacterium]GLD00318.1 monooxygenase [Mycobacterium kiyosense]GLD17075.1 monooxygenase [Mycobacterium kiyosense]GLD42382.1 monooxygenase [Mycobacterium kiyosense]